MPDQAHAAGLEERTRLPGGEQILEHREELLLGRIPGLEQVVVERDLVDRRDRGRRVGIGGQQHALGVGHDLARLREELRARHPRHALIGDQECHLVCARTQLSQDLERLRTRRRAHDAEALAEAAPQIARDRGQHRGVVVDGEDHGPSLRSDGAAPASRERSWVAASSAIAAQR